MLFLWLNSLESCDLELQCCQLHDVAISSCTENIVYITGTNDTNYSGIVTDSFVKHTAPRVQIGSHPSEGIHQIR
jgi:hypothetical protein